MYTKASDLARRYGISPRSLRHYAQSELLTPQRHGRETVYGPDDEAKLLLVLSGRRLGYPLAEIAAIMRCAAIDDLRRASTFADLLDPAEIARRLDVLEARKRDLTSIIEELRSMIAIDRLD